MQLVDEASIGKLHPKLGFVCAHLHDVEDDCCHDDRRDTDHIAAADSGFSADDGTAAAAVGIGCLDAWGGPCSSRGSPTSVRHACL